MNRSKILKLLNQYDWEFLRHSKGSHQMFVNRVTGAKLVIHSLGKATDYSRHSAKALASDIQSRGISRA